MRRVGRHHAGALGKAAALCVFALLLWPAAASAETGRCMDLSTLADDGLATFWMTPSGELSSVDEAEEPVEAGQVELDQQEAPCSDDAEADPSSNLCFEDAGSQISTLPRLLAQWRGEQAAEQVVDSLFVALDKTARTQPVELAEAGLTPQPEPLPADGESCNNAPDQCRSLPPLPPSLVVEGSAPSASRDLFAFHPPLQPISDDVKAWARLRVRPLAGHRDPPDRPPAS